VRVFETDTPEQPNLVSDGIRCLRLKSGLVATVLLIMRHPTCVYGRGIGVDSLMLVDLVVPDTVLELHPVAIEGLAVSNIDTSTTEGSFAG